MLRADERVSDKGSMAKMCDDRVALLRDRLRDARGNHVVFVSHCLLNQNVRYLGGAFQTGVVPEVVDAARGQGAGIHQMPCPEQLAWGGTLKRYTLPAYGAAGTYRYRAKGPLLWLFTTYTKVRYRLLAHRVVKQMRDYARSGVAVDAVVGVEGSPSCGVRTTLDLAGAVNGMAACPLREIDRKMLDEKVIAPNLVSGEGLFTRALERALTRANLVVELQEQSVGSKAGAPDQVSSSSREGS